MRALTVIAVLVMLRAAPPGFAAELKGIEFADRITLGEKSLQLNGVGLRKKSVFAVDVYAAGLYLEKPTKDEAEIFKSNQLKRVEVVFMRDATTEQIIDSWVEGFERNCESRCEVYRDRLNYLNSFMRDVKQGQKVLLTFYPQYVEISTSGEKRKIRGRDFADMVLATFIGKEPPTEDLKMAMLGRDE